MKVRYLTRFRPLKFAISPDLRLKVRYLTGQSSLSHQISICRNTWYTVTTMENRVRYENTYENISI
jgi:hypothetical protein